MIIVSKLKPNTTIYIESIIGTLYVIRSCKDDLINVESSDGLFINGPPKLAVFVGSRMDKLGPNIPDKIIKGGRMVFRFRDTFFMSEPVATALVEGDGWKYEVIT